MGGGRRRRAKNVMYEEKGREREKGTALCEIEIRALGNFFLACGHVLGTCRLSV